VHEKEDLKGKEAEQRTTLHEMDPLAIQALHVLVSFVHDRINVSDSGELVQSVSTTASATSVEVEDAKAMATNSFRLQDDLVAKILWTLDPCTLQNVFLAMAVSFYHFLLLKSSLVEYISGLFIVAIS
jgi:hypothetical protein